MTFYSSCSNSSVLLFDVLFENENPELESTIRDTQHWDRSEKDVFNNNRIMIKTHLLLAFMSNGNIHFHIIFFALLSLIGCLLLFHFFNQRNVTQIAPLIACLFLIPSFTFWSSAMLKESYLIFSLGLLLFSYHQVISKKASYYFLPLILSIYILFLIKPYVLWCLIPALIFLILLDKNFSIKKAILYSQIGFLVPTSLLLGPSIVDFILRKHNEFIALGIAEEANSLSSRMIFDSSMDLLISTPALLLNLFRPSIFEIDSAFTGLNAVENTLLLLLLFYILVKSKSIFCKPINYFIVIFSVYYLILISLTVPIIGALVRYKSIILPFLFLIPFTDESIKKRVKSFRFI